ALEHLFVSLLEPRRHVLQFFFLGCEPIESLIHSLLQRNWVDLFLEASKQATKPPRSLVHEGPSPGPSVGLEQLEWGLGRLRVSGSPVLGRWNWRSLALRGIRRLSRPLSARPLPGLSLCRWRR